MGSSAAGAALAGAAAAAGPPRFAAAAADTGPPASSVRCRRLLSRTSSSASSPALAVLNPFRLQGYCKIGCQHQPARQLCSILRALPQIALPQIIQRQLASARVLKPP